MSSALLQKTVSSHIKQALPKQGPSFIRPFRSAAVRRLSYSINKSTRHTGALLAVVCALSPSARAYAASMAPATATFAAGCFWGVENYFNKHFKDAILKSEVGYTGGEIKNPDYRKVCSGSTGHAEAVRFEYDPSKASFADLVEYFYRIHDPTTPNRQGNDVGTQYRSAIFYEDDEQKRIAEEKTAELQKARFSRPIATEIVPAAEWWSAEDYHQKYLIANPGGYCNHRERW